MGSCRRPALALCLAMVGVSSFAVAAVDDQNLTGLVYLSDGTPLSATIWADSTGLAVWVNHAGSWSASWRYPATGWYLTSIGAYSIVLPASEKDVNWANADPYRVEFDVSAITGNPGERDNATSHGTGDPGEFSPPGASSNTIVWNATDNWQRWDVVLLAPADLAVLPGDVIAIPGTVQVGQVVQISATVRNLGNRSADSSVALFMDADMDQLPDPGEVFDQTPLSLDAGDSTSFVRAWTATAAGTHTLCAHADPANVVIESDEGNNVDCATVVVQAPTEMRPDYFLHAPQPISPIRSGLSRPVSLSVQVRNQGNATAGATSSLAFFNATIPGTPFATYSVSALPPAAQSVWFVATWMSPATPGSYDVIAEADHGDVLVEWDEANNEYEWTIDAVSGPVTTLVLGAPNVTGARTFVTPATDLSLSVLDQSGSGIDKTSYRVDNGTWVNYTDGGPFLLSGEGPHFLEWYSEDFAGNAEAAQSQVLVVDDTPPTTAPSFGDPKHVTAHTFLTSATPVTFTPSDGGTDSVGVAFTEYRLDSSIWTGYAAPFTIAGEGAHTLRVRSHDLLGNVEAAVTVPVTIDDTPPSLVLGIGSPQYAVSQVFVTSSTPLAVLASDGGVPPVGVASVEYRVDGGAWTPFADSFHLATPDGTRHVEYAATDHLGHRASDSRDIVVDDAPPMTTIAPTAGPYEERTIFTLESSDVGSGVARTDVRIDGQGWTLYAGGFTLVAGDHVLRFRSVDNLNHVEAERTVSLTVEGTPPPPTSNWKPLMAAAFAAVLALAGWISSSKSGDLLRSRVVRRFAAMHLPFVVAEVATGVFSLFTGLLSIPPLLGLGALIDSSILIAGLAVSLAGVRASRRLETRSL